MASQSPFHSVDVVTNVAIEPCKLDHALAAVKEKLNTTLFKYNDDVGGIPIAYEDLSFLPEMNYGKIFGESPWLHVEAQAKLTVFSPVLGQRLHGRVNKLSATHISVLIYGMFNVTISADKLRESHMFKKSEFVWESKSQDKSIQEGSVVEFSILSCQHSQGVYFVHGAEVL